MPPGKIQVGSKVSGHHGEYEDPPKDSPKQKNGRKARRKRKKLTGQVVYSVDKEKWRVMWDDGGRKDCFSNTLKYEGEGVPLRERLAGMEGRVLPSSDHGMPPLMERASSYCSRASEVSNSQVVPSSIPMQESDGEQLTSSVASTSAARESSDASSGAKK